MNNQDKQGGQNGASKLELLHGKALIVFSIVASIWAGLTGGLDYWRDHLAAAALERKVQAQAVADVSRVLGVMRFNCPSDSRNLASLGDTAETERDKVCYDAFVKLSTLIYSASILIDRPDDVTETEWRTSWAEFSKGIEEVGTNDYRANRLDCPWGEIARSKNVVFGGTDCAKGELQSAKLDQGD